MSVLRILQRCASLDRTPAASKSAASLEHMSSMYSSSSDERGKTLSIDRSGLFTDDAHSHDSDSFKEPETALAKILKSLIRFRGGPITLAEFMSEALTNPKAGYYMRRDVFGEAGDFTTSPEISQLFGEMLGAWCALQWHRLGRPGRLLLAELGPGRGTLMQDLLRGTSTLPGFAAAVEVHLVEVSEALRTIQFKTLQCDSLNDEGSQDSTWSTSKLTGAKVVWHRSLDSVPADAPVLFLAHEFFDALPAHQFERSPRGWRERLVDVAPPGGRLHFRLVLSPRATPAAALLVPRRLEALTPEQRETITALEISPQAIATAEALARRVGAQDGAALIVDYGQDGPLPGSMRAIRRHAFTHLLASPGDADLSCHVDFSAIRQGVAASGGPVAAHGPMPQAHFLAGLGIQARLEQLLETASQRDAESLASGYFRLLNYKKDDGTSAFPEADETASRSGEDPGIASQPERWAIVSEGSGDAGSSERASSTPSAAEVHEAAQTPVSRDEGMGMAYKVMAIGPDKYSAPIPFPGWQPG